MGITSVLIGGFAVMAIILYEIHKQLARIIELLEEDKHKPDLDLEV